MSKARFEIRIAPTALDALRAVRNRKERHDLVKAIDALAIAPDRAGKALVSPLDGLRSIHAVRDRYRILYRVERRTVQVVLVGKRSPGATRDVYAIASKLIAILRAHPTTR